MAETALLLIDIQNDYFADGRFPLVGMEAAAVKAAQLLAAFRAKGLPVIHVRHENGSMEAPFFRPGTEGADLHASLSPAADEPVVTKALVNSFLETNLQEVLDAGHVGKLVIAGAMSCMCVDSVTRAARDKGYDCTVVHDACAAPDLQFAEETIPAAHVHGAFMAGLAFGFAAVVSADEALAALG